MLIWTDHCNCQPKESEVIITMQIRVYVDAVHDKLNYIKAMFFCIFPSHRRILFTFQVHLQAEKVPISFCVLLGIEGRKVGGCEI